MAGLSLCGGPGPRANMDPQSSPTPSCQGQQGRSWGHPCASQESLSGNPATGAHWGWSGQGSGSPSSRRAVAPTADSPACTESRPHSTMAGLGNSNPWAGLELGGHPGAQVGLQGNGCCLGNGHTHTSHLLPLSPQGPSAGAGDCASCPWVRAEPHVGPGLSSPSCCHGRSSTQSLPVPGAPAPP